MFTSQKGSGLGISRACHGWRMSDVPLCVFIQPWDDGEEGLEVLLEPGEIQPGEMQPGGIQEWSCSWICSAWVNICLGICSSFSNYPVYF